MDAWVARWDGWVHEVIHPVRPGGGEDRRWVIGSLFLVHGCPESGSSGAPSLEFCAQPMFVDRHWRRIPDTDRV